MTLKIEIKMDNSAFAETTNGNEVSRILKTWAGQIEHAELKAGEIDNLRDFNGNKVGTAEVVE